MRIDALAPFRFTVFEKRNHELRYQHGVVRLHMQVDQEAVRMMIAGFVLQDVSRGHHV